jgi:hypothetical protein
MGPSHNSHFLPSPTQHSTTIMTKIWTYPTSQLAAHQLSTLTRIQREQYPYECRIMCLTR